MRDPDILVGLLREMELSPNGRLPSTSFLGFSSLRIIEHQDPERFHHVEILLDLGYAEKDGQDMVRITNSGYDFLDAVRKNNNLSEKFHGLLNRGVPFATAAMKIIGLARKLVD